MYFNGMFCLELWDDEAQYAIFDDWSDWSKFYTYKQFLGAQKEFIVTDKYKHKRKVLWGKPCIVISNLQPDLPEQEWVEMNCISCYLIGPLF